MVAMTCGQLLLYRHITRVHFTISLGIIPLKAMAVKIYME